MSTASVALQKYSFTSWRTYVAAAIFIIGNILVPQLCYLIPNGGLIFLPIYFFTLVGAFKCGWKVGILTAVLSPLVNCVLFGMPPVASLPTGSTFESWPSYTGLNGTAAPYSMLSSSSITPQPTQS